MEKEKNKESDIRIVDTISPQSKELELLYQTQANLRRTCGVESFSHAE